MVQSVEIVLTQMLEKFLDRVPGLELAVISTFDGVGLATVQKGHNNPQQASQTIKHEGSAATVFPFVSEQVSKLCWGDLKSCIAYFEKKTLVHVNLTNVITTFVGDATMDPEVFTNEDMHKRLQKGLAPLVLK